MPICGEIQNLVLFFFNESSCPNAKTKLKIKLMLNNNLNMFFISIFLNIRSRGFAIRAHIVLLISLFTSRSLIEGVEQLLPATNPDQHNFVPSCTCNPTAAEQGRLQPDYYECNLTFDK